MKKNTQNDGIKRRTFLRSTLAGTCTLGLASLLGCTRNHQQPEGPEEREEQPTPAGNGTVDTPAPLVAQKGFVDPRHSPWFTGLENDRIRCTLCPTGCELDKNQRAPCRVRENREGRGYTLAYGNPALIQEDPVERKPFFHVLPGSRALSISTAGCNLECKFCEVWDMALVSPEEVHAYAMPPEAVVAHALDTGVRSLSYAFGEPVIFYEYMREMAKLAHREGLLNLLHTAAYIRPEPLEELCEVIDAVNVDLKSFDPQFYRDIVGGELEPVLRSLKLLWEAGVHLEITTIIIPTLNDDLEMIEEMCGWIVEELGPGVPLHFARFYPLYRLSALPRTPVSSLDAIRETALDAGLSFVYVARVTGHEGENTFCPGCGETIIVREGFVVDEVHLKQGACASCGLEIPGRWS